MPTRYYHGTRVADAVEALGEGGALLARRPQGASRFARSRSASVYLTPSFNQAVEYAYLGGDRADWSREAQVRVREPHVFAFDLFEGHPGIPCEDELGWAAKHAVLRSRGTRAEWSMNDGFATAFDADDGARASLLALVAATDLSRLGDPASWTGAKKAKAGAILSKRLDPDLSRTLVGLGVSVSLPEGPVPVGGYRLERRVMRPEEAVAIEIAGADAGGAPSP